jgi:hypothetical protein
MMQTLLVHVQRDQDSGASFGLETSRFIVCQIKNLQLQLNFHFQHRSLNIKKRKRKEFVSTWDSLIRACLFPFNLILMLTGRGLLDEVFGDAKS